MDTKNETPSAKRFEGFVKCCSAVAFIWIFSLPTIINIVFSIVLSLLVVICLTQEWIDIDDKSIQRVPLMRSIILFAVTAVLGLCLYKRWSLPDSIILVPARIMTCSNIIFGAMAIVITVGAFRFLLQAASCFTNYPESCHLFNEDMDEQMKGHLFE